MAGADVRLSTPEIPAESRLDRYLPGIAGIAMGLLLIGPRASIASLALLAVALVGIARPSAWPALALRQISRPPAAVLLVLALGLWALASTLWAADRSEALGKSALLISLAALAWLAATTSQQAPSRYVARIFPALLIGFAVGLAYLLIEELSYHAIKHSLFSALPFTRPHQRHLGGDAEEISVASYLSNRNMAALSLALWPVLLLTARTLTGLPRTAVSATILLLAVVTITRSSHETSLLAIGASCLVLVLARLSPRLAIGLVGAGWIAATLLVVPLTGWAFKSAELHKAGWLPHSARHRIVLWAYAGSQVAERPLAGIGAASTKLVDQRRGPKVDVVPGTVFQWRSGTHAHNVFLQIWVELGAIGASLLAAAGLALLWSMRGMAARPLSFMLATFTSAAVLGASTWGLWQAWYLGAFAVAAVLAAIALAASEEGANGTAP